MAATKQAAKKPLKLKLKKSGVERKVTPGYSGNTGGPLCASYYCGPVVNDQRVIVPQGSHVIGN